MIAFAIHGSMCAASAALHRAVLCLLAVTKGADMELELAYLEGNKYGRYMVAVADAHNAVKLIDQGWSQITKEQYENPQQECVRLDLTVRGQKAGAL